MGHILLRAWVGAHEPDDEPTHEDYLDWLFDKADLALGTD